MNAYSCRTLILACIINWQACKIERVVCEADSEKVGIGLTLLEHVSPISWDNVLLYGEYVIDPSLMRRS